MKKFLPLVIVLMLSLSLMFSACSAISNILPSKDSKENDGKELDTSQGTDGIVEMDLSKEPFLCVNDLRIVSAKESPKLKTSFKDDNYYYYLFDLGLINNVPLEGFSNLIKHENHGQKTTHTIESSSVESSTITSTVSNTTAESVNTTESASSKVAFEMGEKDVCKVSGEYAYSKVDSSSYSGSYTNTYSNASNFSKTQKKSVSMQFDENAENGYYGYILTGAIEVYAIVAFDIASSIYIVDYFSDIQQYWIDFYFFKTSNDFVNYEYETIPFTVPSDLPIPTEYKNFEKMYWDPIAVYMTRYNCKDGNQYNKREQGNSDCCSRHNGFELGELIIYGCSKDGDIYSVCDATKFSIKYHILHNTEDLPRVGSQSTRLEDDSETRAMNTNINGRLGYGAYWVRITYEDNTQTQYNATNQFRSANSNSYIELINESKIDTTKSISKIEVVVVYELYAGGPGFLGIWWKEYSNWRCEYTYDFIS